MKFIKTYESFYVNDDIKPATIDEIKRAGGVSNASKYLISSKDKPPIDAKFNFGDIVIYLDRWIYKVSHYYLSKNGYSCYVVSYPDGDFSRVWVREDELRLATDKEIEEHELKINSKKYNL